MKVLLMLLLFFGFLFASEDGEKKLVIDLTTGDVKVFEKKILSGIVAHKTHYQNSLEELDVAVVIHGGAYRFFVRDLNKTIYKEDKALQKVFPDLKKRIRSIAETYDVEFLMCDSGRKSNKVARELLPDFVTLVPNSTIGLIDKQSEGYAYIPVSK